MKWLIIIALLLVLFSIIAMRFRMQIQTGIQLWKMFRQFRKATKPQEKKVEVREIHKGGEPLVRCARCGKWSDKSEALNLRSKTFYCSPACMEKAARIESLVDKN